MKPCRECRKDVSEWAEKCPQCGAPNPTFPGWLNGLVYLGAVVIAGAFGLWVAAMVYRAMQ